MFETKVVQMFGTEIGRCSELKVTDVRNEFWCLFFFNVEKDSFIYYILSRIVQRPVPVNSVRVFFK